MPENPLSSLNTYASFLGELLGRSPIVHSTVRVWSASPRTGIAEGEVVFTNGIRLRVRQELDFDAHLITAYGYEVYQHEKRLYWYDDFPHPKDASLAPTYPHHKHVPPDLKHNRIPAPEMSFTRPNLPVLVREIERLFRD
jgi:hypothetical protein